MTIPFRDTGRRDAAMVTFTWRGENEGPVTIHSVRTRQGTSFAGTQVKDTFTPLKSPTIRRLRGSDLLLATASAQCVYEVVTYIWSIDAKGVPKFLLHVNGADLSRLSCGVVWETEPAKWADGIPQKATMTDFLRRRWTFDRKTGRFRVGEWKILPSPKVTGGINGSQSLLQRMED